MTPVFLSVAGSDCSAGAGLQADLKTGYALGCYPLTVVTCVVSEVPGCVQRVVPMEADFVADQLHLCLEHFPVRALKTGMLYSPDIVRAVATELRSHPLPLVVDPVMIATAGEALILQEAISVYEQELIPQATLLTPNLDELSRLLSAPPARTASELEADAAALARRYGCAILAKGGHLEGDTCADVLARPDGTLRTWRHPRITHVNTHGTGCTLSSAVAAGLAAGRELTKAVEEGLSYVAQAIATSHRWGSLHALNHGQR